MMLRQARVRTTRRRTWNAQAMPSARKSTAARWSKKIRASWRKACIGHLERRALEAPAAIASARGRDGMSFALEVVRERLELRRLGCPSVGDGLREQPVREPRVPRQQRSVQGRADAAAEPAALRAPLAVVA